VRSPELGQAAQLPEPEIETAAPEEPVALIDEEGAH
jgi:hypothetical protein